MPILVLEFQFTLLRQYLSPVDVCASKPGADSNISSGCTQGAERERQAQNQFAALGAGPPFLQACQHFNAGNNKTLADNFISLLYMPLFHL